MGFAEQLAARVRDSSVENTNGKTVASDSSTSSFAEELKRSRAARQDKVSPSTAETTPCSDTSSPDDHSIATTTTTQRNVARRLLIPSCNNYEDDEASVGFWDTSNYVDGGINNEKGGEAPPQNACANEENNDNPSDSSASPDSSNAIFGAWAEIDSLKHRVHEAEERARQECQRAEIASYELRLAKERQGICQDDATTDSAAPRNEEATLGEAAVTSAHDERRMRDAMEVIQPPKMIDQETSRTTTSAEADVVQWKKRALEAEKACFGGGKTPKTRTYFRC